MGGKAGTVGIEKRREALRNSHVKAIKDKEKRITSQIDDVLGSIHKKYGAGSINLLNSQNMEVGECVSTGWSMLDDVLTGEVDDRMRTIAGTGRGVPRGRIIEVYGPESSGKTTLGLLIVRAFQKAGHVCAYVDAEHAVDMPYAIKLGVDPSLCLFSQPDSAEEAVEIITTLTRTGTCGLIVVDSVAAMTPLSELEGDAHKAGIGMQARLMSQSLRKLTALAAKTQTDILYINQIRSKIGVMYGSNETTPGGNALRFYASIRIDIRKIKTLKTADRFSGIRSRVRVVKNKVASPFRECFVDIMEGKGIVQAHAAVDVVKSKSKE